VGWIRLVVSDRSGRAAALESKVRRDVVEWWFGPRAVALMDRQRLGAWLSDPVGDFSCDEVVLSRGSWGPLVQIVDRLPPTLVSPLAIDDLRERVKAAPA
jgi:hypothetical protein